MPDVTATEETPIISLIVLSWNNVELTRACVESLRRTTDVEYELIAVDNGSTDGAAEFAGQEADIAVLNGANLGFAVGMNKGLERATGEYVAFVNNDTTFPHGWASQILETFTDFPNAGLVIPAVTAAGNPITVRQDTGSDRKVLIPFGEFPSGVVYVMRTSVIRALGGWNEDYKTASAEDLDLVFTVWAHGLDAVLDERVLIDHVSQASVRNLPDRKEIYRRNLVQFLDRWESMPLGTDALLPGTDPEVLRSRQEQARLAIVWIRRMLEARQERDALKSAPDRPAAGDVESRKRSRWRFNR